MVKISWFAWLLALSFALLWFLRSHLIPPISLAFLASNHQPPKVADFPLRDQVTYILQYALIFAFTLTSALDKVKRDDKGAKDEDK